MRTDGNHVTIFRDPSHYSTFPWVERLGDNTLLVVFREADEFSRDAAAKGLVTHHDTGSWISALISDDNGRSWRPDSYHVAYRSEFGVNDPAITRVTDGSVVLRVSEVDVRPSGERARLDGTLVAHRVEHGRVSAVRGNVLVKLDPGSGKTAKAGRLVDAGEHTRSSSREPVTELPDGSWVLPVYWGAPFGVDSAYLLRSYDRGGSWGDASVILRDATAGPSDLQGINFNETSILVFPDGEMLAVGRADRTFHSEGEYIPVGGVGELYVSRSYNWGLSWSPAERTGIFGQPAHVLLAGGDRVVCAYGYRKKPYGVHVVESLDRGRSWRTGDTLVLREGSPSWDMGYPMTIRLDEGLFLTVYYYTDQDSVRFIAGSTWSLG